jgi:hypothetical protein
MALGGEDVVVALFGAVHFGRGGLNIARLFVDAPKRNLCARATPKTTMAITRSKCGNPKKRAPKKRSAAKGPAVPKKRIAKNVKDRAWQLQLVLGFEQRPGPELTPKNNLLRELFAELDQLYKIHPTLKRENQLWL